MTFILASQWVLRGPSWGLNIHRSRVEGMEGSVLTIWILWGHFGAVVGRGSCSLPNWDLPMSASFPGLGELLHSTELPIPLFGDGDWRLGLQNRSRPAVRCVKPLTYGSRFLALCREAHSRPRAWNSLWPWQHGRVSTQTPSKNCSLRPGMRTQKEAPRHLRDPPGARASNF